VNIIECPHCYTRVAARSDDSCPACQQNTIETSGADRSKTQTSVPVQSALPPVCCQCGVSTHRYVEVSATVAGNAPSPLARFVTFLLMVSIVGFFLFEKESRGFQRRRDRLRVRMPQCDVCAQNGPPVLEYVDSENYRMTFVVDRAFKDAIVSVA